MSRPGTAADCEVLVVGGGPAGSSLAWSLRRRGVDVVVLDRAEFPRDKVCAGWVTPAVVDALELDVGAYGRDHVLQPIRSFRVGLVGGPTTATRASDEPVSFGIRRCEFDDYLLRRSGARLRLGQTTSELRREGGCWRLNGAISARLVVGAGGHFCPVARALGAGSASHRPTVLAQEIEFAMSAGQARTCPVDPQVPELFFCRDLRGYGWVFRKGDFLNVGLGREDPRGLSGHTTRFIESLVASRRVPADMPQRPRGHAYRLYPRADYAPFDDGVLLIGDAAGLAYAESGEGIRPAVESGLLAAETILDARGDYRRATLAAYGRRLTERFGPRREARGLATLLPAPLRRWTAERLLATEWFARRVVVNRWFLRAHLPRLAVNRSADADHRRRAVAIDAGA